MNKEEALKYLSEEHDFKDVESVSNAIIKVLSECYTYYDDIKKTIYLINSNELNTKLYSAVEIEQKYLDKHNIKIVIRCNDKYAHVFSDSIISIKNIKTISEYHYARNEYEVLTLN